MVQATQRLIETFVLQPGPFAMLPCIHMPPNVVRVMRHGRRMPRFTTVETEERLGLEKLNQEYNSANQVARGGKPRQIEFDMMLGKAETMLQVTQEKLSVLAREHNALPQHLLEFKGVAEENDGEKAANGAKADVTLDDMEATRQVPQDKLSEPAQQENATQQLSEEDKETIKQFTALWTRTWDEIEATHDDYANWTRPPGIQ